MPLGVMTDQCALNADGTYKNVSEIEWFNDPKDKNPIVSCMQPTVMIDLLLLVASHWGSQGEFLKTTDHSEEGKNTEGQYNDQDL